MNEKFFENVDYENNPHWVVKEFFNSIYQQGEFLWALPLIVGKRGCTVNEEFCFFPDLSDSDPVYHFQGVTFGTFGVEVVITDEQCGAYLREACERYVEKNPAARERIAAILNTSDTGSGPAKRHF
jgi:hypothetical protein